MRKIATLSMVAAASLFVAACGGSEPAATDNATVTEMNAGDAMEGTTNDSMTGVDAGMGADANMSADNMMGSNMSGDMSGNMSGNMTDSMSNSTK